MFNDTESWLVKALKEKNNAAYHQLYKHYKGSLFSIISNIIPETEVAEDVLQETFITVWKNIDKYDSGKGRLFTWLLNLARNTAINKLHSKNYRNSLKNDDITNFVNDGETMAAKEMNINQIGLRQEVRKLKEDQKNVLELFYFNGFTQEEISKALKIPLGTVKTRLRMAIIELRKHIR